MRSYRVFLKCSAAAILASTALPNAAIADEAEEDANQIVVTGARPIAESEAAALQVQKNADSLVTVAASDSVGRLPDQNIAQATGRLPGVAVERDQGQARYISLRGAPNYWTTLSFDGINVVSPEGRDARFDSIPSAIASQIIVSKAVTPDDLPPSEWPNFCFRIGYEGGMEWRGNTSRRRSSASCVRPRSCWRRAERWRMPAAVSGLPNRATTAGARSMAA